MKTNHNNSDTSESNDGGKREMAKSKAGYWLTDVGLLKIRGWARDGYTEAQIAGLMHVSMSTLSNYKIKYVEILEALKIGKEEADLIVEEALIKNATGFWTEETTTEKMFDEDLGKLVVVREKTVKKFIPANPTSQIFWLKNRNSEKWKDKREEKIETENEGLTITINGFQDYAG